MIVELGDSGVRLLAQVTGVPPGNVGIGDRGEMVLRVSPSGPGIPDYGYAFSPARRLRGEARGGDRCGHDALR